MRSHLPHRLAFAAALPLLASSLLACGAAGLDPRLYTINLTQAPIPVMLSDTKVRNPGRLVEAVGRRGVSHTEGTYVSQTVTTWSRYSPSEQLLSQIGGGARLLQVRSIACESVDYNNAILLKFTNQRALRVEAEAVP